MACSIPTARAGCARRWTTTSGWRWAPFAIRYRAGAGRAGLASRDSAALAEAILTAARDPELRERIGREARRRVARHSLERVVDAYDELLGRAARPEGA